MRGISCLIIAANVSGVLCSSSSRPNCVTLLLNSGSDNTLATSEASAAPNVLTVAEQGYPGFKARGSRGKTSDNRYSDCHGAGGRSGRDRIDIQSRAAQRQYHRRFRHRGGTEFQEPRTYTGYLPAARNIAVLHDPNGLEQLQQGAKGLQLDMRPVTVPSNEEMSRVFASMSRERPDAVILPGNLPTHSMIEFSQPSSRWRRRRYCRDLLGRICPARRR